MELLFKNFEQLADAPNGVKKLRELILQLAIKGNLFENNPSDEPIEKIIEENKNEKIKLIQDRKLKEYKISEFTDVKKMRYPIPINWRWYRFGEVVFYQEGPGIRNWQFKTEGIKLLNVKNILSDSVKFDNSDRYVSEGEFNDKYKHFLIEEGDLLFASSGGSWGKCAWYVDPGYKVMLNTSTIRLKFFYKDFVPNYLYYFLNTIFFKEQMRIQLVGMQPNFGSTHLSRVYIPIPPIEEQKRIVAKVDQLMALCDQLEKQKEQRDKKRISLNQAALNKLLTSREPAAFQQHWQRIVDHFDLFYDVPENVAELKKAILQLAVMGKLVPQNPDDETASELLKHIQAEKNQLIREGKIKKEKPLPPISENEIPYELPTGWVWMRLGNLTELITKGSSPKWQGIDYVEKDKGVLFITSKNVGNYKLILEEQTYVEWKFNEIEPRSILQENDILMNIVGASIGRTAIYKLNQIANINQAVCLIRLLKDDGLSQNYLLHFFNSPICISYMFDKQVEMARPNLSMGNVERFFIPLPPIEEQKRIVAKVDVLMKLCDELEEKLKQSKQESERLLEAVVQRIINLK